MLAQIEASGSGLVGLCWYDAGARSYYTTKKVASVADMKGLKIRMPRIHLLPSPSMHGKGRDTCSFSCEGILHC